jgi:hypothetical protein
MWRPEPPILINDCLGCQPQRIAQAVNVSIGVGTGVSTGVMWGADGDVEDGDAAEGGGDGTSSTERMCSPTMIAKAPTLAPAITSTVRRVVVSGQPPESGTSAFGSPMLGRAAS